MSSAETCTSVASYSVDFINKDYCGRILSCGIKQITYSRCADADVHFNKVGTGDGVERYACFTRNCLCYESFTCSGRSYEKNAVGNFCTELCEVFGIA